AGRRAGGRQDPRAGVAGGRPAQEAGHPGRGAGRLPAPQHEGRAPAPGDAAQRRAGAPRPRRHPTPGCRGPACRGRRRPGHGAPAPGQRELGVHGIEPLTFPSRSAVLWPALVAAATAAAHVAVAKNADQFVATAGEARLAAATFAARGADFGAVTLPAADSFAVRQLAVVATLLPTSGVPVVDGA